MKKIKQNEISKRIIKSYEDNMQKIPLVNIGHFFTRAYRITGNKRFEKILLSYFFLVKEDKIKNEVKNFKTNKFKFADKKPKNKRHIVRYELYKRNPKLKAVNSLIFDIFIAKSFHVEKHMGKYFKEAVDILKNEDLKKLYLDGENLRRDSSFSINSVFLLKHLGIAEIDKEAVAIVRELYFNEKNNLRKMLPKWEFQSLIYSLTHIIIAESRYYQNFVEGHEWILDFFDRNIEDIMHKTTNDIISEVGLCFKLCKKEKKYSKSFNLIRKFMVDFLNNKEIENEKFLVTTEHTNSITAILFSDVKKFYQGPNLSVRKIV